MHSSSTAARGRVTWLVAAAVAVISIHTTAWAQAPKKSPKAEKPASSQAAPKAGSTGQTPAAPVTAPDVATTTETTGEQVPAAQPPASPASSPSSGTPATPAGEAAGAAGDSAEEAPVNLRLRRLEQQVQALKERSWRAKARVGMLKEAVLGGGVGASATIVHVNNMGSSYRLIKLVYALDGTQIFARNDDSGALHKNKNFDILTGPIAPGSHTLSVLAIYRGNGYGVFKYLNKYKFTVRSSHTFTVSEGKATRIESVAFERGGVTTPLDQRPAMDFKVTLAQDAGGAEAGGN